MDFETLVWLLILLLPLVGRIFGKKPQPGEHDGAAERPQQGWADALEELRTALDGGVPQTGVPAPEPVPQTTVPKAPLERATSQAPRYFEETSYDDVFEARPRFVEPKHAALHLDHPAPLPAPTPRSRYSREARLLRKQLHDRKRLGEAFVLAEILGPPRSKRPRRR